MGVGFGCSRSCGGDPSGGSAGAALVPAADGGARPVLLRVPDRPGPSVPIPSGDVLWGVSIPAGCIARKARRFRVEFTCQTGADAIRRFYRFRFPAAELQEEGRAFTVRPAVANSGYARVLGSRIRRFGTRLTVYRGGYGGRDPYAQRLVRLYDASQVRTSRPSVVPLPDVPAKPSTKIEPGR